MLPTPVAESYFTLHQDLIELIAAEFPETLPGSARQAMGIDAPHQRFDTALEGRASYEIGLSAKRHQCLPAPAPPRLLDHDAE